MIDAHAHLTDPRFQPDLEAVIERARAAGLTRILTCGEDVASSEAALALAHRHPDLIRVAVGVHPHRAASLDDAALAALAVLARDALVVAIGEIGVDLSGRSARIEDQRRAFGAQLDLASRLRLPAVIHVRDAADEVRACLDTAPGVPGQLHCYSGTASEVAGWVERGLFLSFAGTVTFKSSDALRAAAAVVPAERLLAETDSPYLTPEPRRGERNEPARVGDTYARLAEVHRMSVGALTERLAANARALFGPRWNQEPPGVV